MRSLFDGRVFARHLEACWLPLRQGRKRLHACELVRVQPRPRGGAIFQYALCLEQAGRFLSREIHAEWCGADAPQRCREIQVSLFKKRRRQIPKDAADAFVFCLPELGVVVRLAGLDERLPGLTLLYDANALRAELEACLGPVDAETPTVDLLGHRLGKRCIFRVHYRRDEHPGSVVLKVYKQRGDKGRRVFETMRTLRRSGGVTIPEPLAFVQPWQLLLMEDVAFPPWMSQLTCRDANAHAAVGEALAALHRADVPPVADPHSVADERALIERRVTEVVRVFPALAASLRVSLARAHRALHDTHPAPEVTAHRDFYEKQVMVQGERVCLIDFDTLCRAEAAIDLGNYLAHLTLRRLQGMDVPQAAERWFLEGYGVWWNEALRRRIAAYERATLLRLACLYAFRPRWRHLVPALLRACDSD